MSLQFNLPKENSSIIKVIGVGGGGSNAVNHMYEQGIKGVDFLVCNTDQQALDASPVPLKIQLGTSLTEGRGAGSLPEVGMNAAIENLDDIKEILSKNTKMVFVTAGMGGGTGTGAGPVIAKAAKEMGILTVGIVTVPFVFEGKKRRSQAEAGIERMREAVDTLLVINNDKLREMFGNLTLGNAFSQADDVLTIAARGIAEVISVTGAINVDFNDVNTVMRDSGVAIMGSAQAEGDDRATAAVHRAMSSPLLNDNQIVGAKYVLLNITYGDKEVLMDEIAEITDYIQEEAGSTADVIWGHGYDESLGDKLSVTLIATGFKTNDVDTGLPKKAPEKRVVNLEEERSTMITQPIENPMSNPIENRWQETEKTVGDSIDEEPFLIKKEVTDADEPNSEDKSLFQVNDQLDFSESDESSENTSNIDLEKTSFNEEIKNPIKFSLEDEEEITDETEAQEFTAEKNEIVETSREWNFSDMSSTEEENEEVENEIEFSKDESESSFTVQSSSVNEKAVKKFNLDDEEEEESKEENKFSAKNEEEAPSPEDAAELARLRMERIKMAGDKMKSQEGLEELEKEPAYIRRKLNIDESGANYSKERSRFTLGDIKDSEGNKRTGLSDNNSFLHDNVD